MFFIEPLLAVPAWASKRPNHILPAMSRLAEIAAASPQLSAEELEQFTRKTRHASEQAQCPSRRHLKPVSFRDILPRPRIRVEWYDEMLERSVWRMSEHKLSRGGGSFRSRGG